MTLEDQFYHALDEWNQHRAEHIADDWLKSNRPPKEVLANSLKTLLDGKGYNTLVSLGPEIFPYIRNEMQGRTQSRYNNEIYIESKLKEIETEATEIHLRLFNTTTPNLNRQTTEGMKNDHLLLDDQQYNKLLDKRMIIEVGDPKTLWCYLLSTIDPEFKNPAQPSFFPDQKYVAYTLQWLEEKLK